jgi:hypothetical protein
MLDRKKMSATVNQAIEKAGTLVVATLIIASCALLVSLVALVMTMRARPA